MKYLIWEFITKGQAPTVGQMAIIFGISIATAIMLYFILYVAQAYSVKKKRYYAQNNEYQKHANLDLKIQLLLVPVFLAFVALDLILMYLVFNPL